jgi:hypothetical protein
MTGGGWKVQTRRAEVVQVVSPEFLVSSEGRAYRYKTWKGRPLADGYYLALWPRHSTSLEFDSRVRFYGPCESEMTARLIEDSAHALGLMEPPRRRQSMLAPRRAGMAVVGIASWAVG